MSDDEPSDAGDELDGDDVGTPDTDPRHVDPAGEAATILEDHMTDAELGEDTDVDDVRAFVEAAERGEFGPADAALEAQVRIARAILEAVDDDDATE